MNNCDARTEPGPWNQVWCGDSIQLLAKLPDASVDLILSDIPYGIGLDHWDVLHPNQNSAYLGASPAQHRAGRAFRKRGKPINGWSAADRQIPYAYYDWCCSWAADWLRVLKPGGSAFVFAGRRYTHRCAAALEDAGFNFRDQLAWLRPHAFHRAQRLSRVFERRGDSSAARAWQGWRLGNLRPRFEPIIWCCKPYRITLADNVLEHGLGAYNQAVLEQEFQAPDNIFSYGLSPGESGLHPAQKPLRLMEALISLATLPNHIVLDPFAGSGTTALAAQCLKRRFLAIESNPRLCEQIQQRLEEQCNS